VEFVDQAVNALASSTGLRFSRWMFSMSRRMAIARPRSGIWRHYRGCIRGRRSLPAAPAGGSPGNDLVVTSGQRARLRSLHHALALIEAASSSSASGFMWVRGWYFPRCSWSMGIWRSSSFPAGDS